MKKKLWNRGLSLLLVLAMLVSLAPAAFASEAAPGGTETVTEETETPGTGTETPGTGTETPGTGTETPGTGTETPGTGTETPGEETEPPLRTPYQVNLTPSTVSRKVGETARLTASVTDASGAPVTSLPEGVTIRWVSSDPLEVSVTDSTGLTTEIQALKTAETDDPIKEVTITVTVTANGVGYTDTCQVTVSPTDPTGLTITPGDDVELDPNGTLALSAAITPEGADQEAVTWSSSSPDTASVDASGLVTAGGAPGAAVITARTPSGLTDSLTVTVRGLVLPETATVLENQSTSITVTAYGEALRTQVDRANITWASGNDSILRVESGYLYPVSVGTTTVTATVEANGRTYTSNTCTVTVEANVADVIRASASVGSPLSFSSITSQLRGECQDVLGASLSYVSGLRVDTSQGTLYYHYQSEADTGAGVGTSENYYPYPGASQLALSDVTFVPKPDFSGTAVISYTGYASSSSFFQGTIEVRVEEAEDVSYSTSADRAIQFNADDFNRVCRQRLGRDLSYVTFILPSAADGTLYQGYVSELSPGRAVESGAQYSRSSLSDVYFVPAAGSSGRVLITYTAYDVNGSSYRGRMTIQVSAAASAGDVNYSISQGGRVTMDADDFNALSRELTGAALDSVQFQLPASSEGTLYYNYTSSGSYDNQVTESNSYYRSSSPYLRRVTFVAAENYSGTVEIPFTARNTRGERFTGTVEITVSRAGGGDIRYSCRAGGQAGFEVSDFNTLCRDITGASLSYVRFTLPDTSVGRLYYDYGGSNEERVTASRSYYRAQRPYLDQVSFVPMSGFSGTVEIEFNAWSTSGERFTGAVEIQVEAAAVSEPITYRIRSGQTVTFNSTSFDGLCQDLTGDRLSYIRFELPAASQGTLYYQYNGGSYESEVSANQSYYWGQRPYLNRVTFVPASGYYGAVSIAFTGRSTGNETFRGTVEIVIEEPANASVILYSTGYQPVTFQAQDFINACSARGAGALSYVRFTQTSSAGGQLYYGYTGAGGFQAQTGVSYYPDSSPSLSELTFVPQVGYTGTTTFTYTGWDTQGNAYQGQVQISCQASYYSQHFTDMANYAWAASAVDYLYEAGVVAGGGDGRFRPGEAIIRADFVLMLYRAFSLGSAGVLGAGFPDVPADSYYAQAVRTAQALGITTGTGSGDFRPYDPITRQDAAVLLQRTMQRIGRDLGTGNTSLLSNYSDGWSVASYAQSAVAVMLENGILSGDESGALNPRSAVTRAEMAVMLSRAMTL